MNGCANGYWTATWRPLNSQVELSSYLLFSAYFDGIGELPADPDAPATSVGGVMGGSWCEQPSFVFESSTDSSNLVDVVVLYQRWVPVP